MDGVTYDTGVLIAADRNDQRRPPWWRRASGMTGEEGVTEDIERTCLCFAERTAERIDRWSDGDLFEP